jgi:hypothetical protein
MRRVMKEVSVSTDKKESLIRIAQLTDDPHLEGDSEIFLVLEQVPTLGYNRQWRIFEAIDRIRFAASRPLSGDEWETWKAALRLYRPLRLLSQS